MESCGLDFGSHFFLQIFFKFCSGQKDITKILRTFSGTIGMDALSLVGGGLRGKADVFLVEYSC